MKKCLNKKKKFLSIVLIVTLLATILPIQAFADAFEHPLEYLTEVEIAEDILNDNVFYFATVEAHIPENSGMSHVIRIGRGGDCEEAASVTVKISDYSAHYGDDYTVALLDGNKADAPKNMYAITDLMTGDYEAGAIADEEEVLNAMENEPGFAEEATDAINSAIGFIEENADLTPADGDDDGMAMTELSSEAEKMYKSPLQQAYTESTGITAEHQKVTANGSSDPMKEMQNIADLVNDLTIGATLEVPFDAGQKSRYIVVTPKNNSKAEGNRYFYLTLTDPQGATVSSSASCAVTILDDEEVGPCKVSFDGYEINDDNTSVRVYVQRNGCLNQITDVTLTTTDEGTAVPGRDYSTVDTSVVFPIGVPKLPIDVPINTQYISGDKTFELKLTPKANAEVPEQESRLSVCLTGSPRLLAGTGAQNLERSLATVELDDGHAIKGTDFSDPLYSPHRDYTSQFDGNNRYDSSQKGWLTEWISYWDWGWKDGNVSASFPVDRTLTGNQVAYSGVNMDIKKNGDCAVLGVGFGTLTACSESGTNVSGNGMECVYWSDSPFEGTKNFFSSEVGDGDWCVKIENASCCSDCNRIWVKSITPIYRWYEFTVETKPENCPTFLTAAGYHEPLAAKDTIIYFNSAKVDAPSTALTHYNDKLTMHLGESGSKYLTITNIKGTNGYSYQAGSDLKALNSGVYEWDIKYHTISEAFSNAKFYENPYQKGAGGNHPKYGAATFYATFEHKPATVKINDVRGLEGTKLNLSGTEYGEGTYTFNKGDIIRISCTNIPVGYRFAGVDVKSKINETDVAVRSERISADEDGALFLDGDASNRLQKGYYEITPIFEKENNSITILVEESDIQNKLADYGIFDKANTYEYQSVTIGGRTYRKYRMKDVTAGRLYSLPVMTTKASYFPQWTTVDNTTYSGSVFYFRPDAEPDNNVLTLSVIDSETGLDSLTMSGTIKRNDYNVSTRITENGVAPFENVLVICGAGAKTESWDSFEGYTAASATTDLKGRYSLDLMVKKGTALRYLVTYNGKTDLRELSAEEIRRAIDQYDSRLTNNLTLNTENGSLLSQLSITTDNASSGGGIITMFNGGGVTLTVNDGGGCAYKKIMPQDNGLFREEQAIERLTALEVVIRDSNGNERTTIEAKEIKTGEFSAFINYSGLQSGDMIYLKATSNREPTGLVPLDEVDGDETLYADPSFAGVEPVTFYHEIFSGYTLVESTGTEVPTYIQFKSVPDINFISLPMVDEMGFYCNFPYIHVNMEKVSENVYLMSIGASVMDVVDSVKGSYINQYNNGGIYDAFLQTDTSSIVSSFKSGMQGAAKLIDNVRQSEKAGTSIASALGGPSWRFNVAVGAYMKFELMTIDEEYDFFLAGVGGYLGVQGGFRWNVYWAAPVVCVPMYFGVQADVMVNGYFGSSVDPDLADNPVKISDVTGKAYASGNLDTFDSSIRMLFNGAIYLGVGLCGTLGVRGGGQVMISALWQNNKPDWMKNDMGAAILFKAGIWLDLFVATIPIMYSFPQISLGSVKEIRERASQGASLLSKNAEQTVGEFRFREPYTDEKSDWTGGEPTETFGFRTVNVQTLVKNPYEHPEAQLCELDNGKMLLAFIDSNGSKDATSRTELKVSVCDNGNKIQWSEPITVQNDDTSDFQPRLTAMKDGKALLAWVSAAPGSEDVDNVSEYLSSLEIYAAVIDTESGEMIGEPYRLTKDKYYDSQPVCVYDDLSGEYAVFYVKADPFKNSGTVEFKTPDAIANPYTNDSVVAYMLHADVDGEGGKWLDDQYFKNENALPIDEWNGQRFFAAPIQDLGIYSPAIADLTAAVYNGKIIFAYTIDGDSDNETDADKEIYVQTYDFSKHEMDDPIRITSDAISDVRPQLVENRVNDEEAVNLFWFRGGKQIVYTHISDLLDNGITDHAISKDYKAGKHTEEKEAGLERIYSYVRPSGVSEDELIGMSNFRVVTAGDHGEDIYVIWTQAPDDESGAEGCVELYSTAFLGSEESEIDPVDSNKNRGTDWARPYRLSYNAGKVSDGKTSIVDEPTAALLGDGLLVVVSNSYYQQFTDDPNCPVVFSDLKLTATTMEPCGSVEVTDIKFSDQTPMNGDMLKMTVNVQNTGLTYANGYTLDVSVMKDDDVLKKFDTIRCDTRLRPGENRTEEITWNVTENVSGAFVRISAKETGGQWDNDSVFLSENFKEAADLSLVEKPVPVQTENGMVLRFSILNSGNGVSSSEDVLRVLQVGPYCNNCGLTDDERLFAEVSLAGINPGESKDFEVGLKAPISCFDRYGYVECYVYVVQGEEEKLGKSVMIKPEKPLEVLLNGERIPETISMKSGETMPLAVSIAPALKETTLFTSNNEAVVSIENGELVANKPGTAELTCLLMPLGMQLDPITVTVKSKTNNGGGGSRSIIPTNNKDSSDDKSSDTEEKTEALTFVDVAKDAYYAEAVRWAATNDITEGTDTTHFSPDDSVTRAQVVTFLWRAAGCPEPTDIESRFTDVPVNEYYAKAVAWAVEQGVTKGTDNTSFTPDATCTRGQIVTFLARFANVKDTDTESTFVDVKSTDYFAAAVKWAKDNAITQGTGDATFSPNNYCTRAQAVTFLYRLMTMLPSNEQ